MKPGDNVELQLTLKDLTAQRHLGQYNAEKFRAVIYDIRDEKEKAKQAMGKAYAAWISYTKLMDELYKATDMQRNRGFSSWHEYDDVVAGEYRKLGGIVSP